MKPSPARLARLARRVAIGLALLATVYLWRRFDLRELPSEGCSPLFGLPPGARFIVDVWARDPAAGSAVLFESSPGRLNLGRVQPAPEDLDGEARALLDAGAHWILVDDAECPGLDSASVGPIPAGALRGRIVLVL